MSALTSPKGPLPSRVYWFRRLVVLSVVFVVVFGTARLLTSGSDAKSDDRGQVTTVSAEAPTEPGATEGVGGPETAADGKAKPKGKRKKAKRTPPPLPEPTGVCANDEVLVTPVVPEQRTSVKVPITLVLRTTTTEACTWQVSPRSVTVKIDSGTREAPDQIWHSRHCPAALPTQELTVYRDHDAEVEMVWSGRRSDEECSNLTDWARAGWYHVNAAAYAGEPTSVQFQLNRPSPVTVTRTVDPKPGKKSKKKTSSPKPAPQGTPKPSGAVEPDLD
ncbi:hypothetical protein IEQ44_12745 [Nocardioides sp. Y6]|uniref:DUF4232 domain-containing protein n=1 Tax=Nocardioides malaquae TaxID=2773426 RepID=A0ABR9RV88_9ACTN|nr:hypothetical protein [Nocardioides malaquae]MBE7325519.1 hypothetical protein [Nocardioides malaquae]